MHHQGEKFSCRYTKWNKYNTNDVNSALAVTALFAHILLCPYLTFPECAQKA